MKRKFFSVLFALVLVLSMSMIMAPPALAATAVTDVWVEFDDTNSRNSVGLTTNEYIIHFKPTTALARGVDYVTVTFPDGTSAMGGNATTYAFSIAAAPAAADLEFSTNYGTKAIGDATWTASTSAATYGGYRVKIRVPSDYAAGTDVWLKISSTNITAAATAGANYKVKVATTKDTTAVLSSTFSLGHATTVITSVSTSVAPATAGATGQYTITFTPATALTQSSGKVTVRFPIGTTLPSSMTASNVEVLANGGSFTACGVTPTVDTDRRIVTITTPVALEADSADQVKFLSAAGITNPTIADASGDYYCSVRTSGDREWVVAGTDHDITAGAATKLMACNGNIGTGTSRYSDDATMINMLSSQIFVTLGDVNGNAIAPESDVTVTPSSSSATGTFYKNAHVTPGSGAYSTITSVTVSTASPATEAQQVYYKDTAAGTYTLTFAASGYTSATWTVTVAPAVSLYDANNTLVNTYAASSTSPVAEIAGSTTITTQKYSVDYINSAITAAMAGDTVKLGDGTYELNAKINLNKKVTLTSVNGAASTTLRPVSEPMGTPYNGQDLAVLVAVSGTSTNPVIIDGLTFTRLRSASEFDMAIFNNGYNYVTVQNCTFNYIIPSQVADHEYGSVVGFYTYKAGGWTSVAAITSATISNNTFNNCCTFGFTAWGEQGAVINVFVKDSSDTDYAITGVTVSGNTLTDCNGIGIAMKGLPSGGTPDFKGNVTDNTLTNSVYPLSIQGYSDGINVLRNTITGGYMAGLWVEFTEHKSLVIKNNTITGCAGTGASSMDYSAAVLLYDDGGDTDEVTVQYNAIYDNDATYSIYAVSSIAGGAQNCQYNYYGDATGPYYSALSGATITKSNTSGTGKKVTDLVTYYPWLHKSLADVVADNASYQASTMKLVSGWNTLSTPVQLIAAADAVDELIPSGMTIGYYYDGGWQQITTGKVLSPCDAVYVKMSAATDVLLKFDAGAFTTPSKDLAAGWNLVSLAYLASAGKSDLATVASVAKTPANLPGYSQLVSPSLNATQTNMFGVAGTSWAYAYGEATANSCYAGLGYWVYMQNAATLAGFEITPIAPDLD